MVLSMYAKIANVNAILILCGRIICMFKNYEIKQYIEL